LRNCSISFAIALAPWLRHEGKSLPAGLAAL
jgi:hypothetical protein